MCDKAGVMENGTMMKIQANTVQCLVSVWLECLHTFKSFVHQIYSVWIFKRRQAQEKQDKNAIKNTNPATLIPHIAQLGKARVTWKFVNWVLRTITGRKQIGTAGLAATATSQRNKKVAHSGKCWNIRIFYGNSLHCLLVESDCNSPE